MRVHYTPPPIPEIPVWKFWKFWNPVLFFLYVVKYRRIPVRIVITKAAFTSNTSQHSMTWPSHHSHTHPQTSTTPTMHPNPIHQSPQPQTMPTTCSNINNKQSAPSPKSLPKLGSQLCKHALSALKKDGPKKTKQDKEETAEEQPQKGKGGKR